MEEEDINRELETVQRQNALIIDKKDGIVDKGNTITVNFVELDDSGAEKEQTKREGFTFEVGTGYNLYRIDEDVVGMSKDETKTIEKEYPEDYEYSELAGKSVTVHVEVTAVKESMLPEIDDELAQVVIGRGKMV